MVDARVGRLSTDLYPLPVVVVNKKSPQLRPLTDRVRQIALFELGGLILITPAFVWSSGVPVGDSIGLLAVLALLAALWNGGYNSACDWVEGRWTGRTADRRPVALRVLHALGFEGGFIAISLPVIAWWTGMDWLTALVADLALALAYVCYAFVFNLGYDRVFPIASAGSRTVSHGE